MNLTTTIAKNDNNSNGENTKLTVSSGIFVAIGVSMSVLFVLALAENILVLYVYKKTKTLHTRTNYWIASVISCDLLIVVNAFPFVIVSSFAEEYIFGEIGCKWDGFIVTLLGTTSIFLLTGLSVQRYFIMIKSQKQTAIRKSQTMTKILFCFLFGFLWAILPLIGWGSYSLEGIHISCAPNWKSNTISDKSYTLSMFVFVLFIPCIILAFCYTRILYKVWKERRKQSEWIRKQRVKRDIQVTFSVAMTIGCFLLSWSPYAVVSLCESLLDIDVESVSLLLVQLPCLMAKASCMVNPLVYVCHNSDFKDAFRNLFLSLKDKYWVQTAKPEAPGLCKRTGIPMAVMHVKDDNGNMSDLFSDSAEPEAV